MRPLAGIVVEYLVVGSTSALWILMLLVRSEHLPHKLPTVLLVTLLPLLYVFGMLSDRLGRLLIEARKRRLESKLHEEYGRHVSTQQIGALLVVHLPALATQLEVRRTRDRISRGVLANVPFLTVAAAMGYGDNADRVLAILLAGVLLYLAVLSMWQRYQSLSSKYEIHCDRILRAVDTPGLPD